MRAPGGYIRTFTGRSFWPLDPRPEDVCIEDIAHGLSNNCRWGGQCGPHYSIAQHSVFVSELLPPEHAFCGLMHDASEAVLLDLPRPVKRQLPDYGKAENALMTIIAGVFGFDWPMPCAVKVADNVALFIERRDLFKAGDESECLTDDALDFLLFSQRRPVAMLQPLSPAQAKELFLHKFHSLYVAK